MAVAIQIDFVGNLRREPGGGRPGYLHERVDALDGRSPRHRLSHRHLIALALDHARYFAAAVLRIDAQVQGGHALLKPAVQKERSQQQDGERCYRRGVA